MHVTIGKAINHAIIKQRPVEEKLPFLSAIKMKSLVEELVRKYDYVKLNRLRGGEI